MKRMIPFDNEACVMLEHLTEREVVTNEFSANFIVYAFYEKHNTPEYISAIIDATRGRFGERFLSVADNPGMQMLKFTIAYDKQNLPRVYGDLEQGTPRPYFGITYCHQLEEIKAVQVKRENTAKLQMFVGGGQIAIDSKNGKCWFTFLNNGIYVDVPENDYIVKREGKAVFEIWPPDQFKREWEPKN